MGSITSRNTDDIIAALELRRRLEAEAKDRLIAALTAALGLWVKYHGSLNNGKGKDKSRKLRLEARRATEKALA